MFNAMKCKHSRDATTNTMKSKHSPMMADRVTVKGGNALLDGNDPSIECLAIRGLEHNPLAAGTRKLEDSKGTLLGEGG
jgi:hypothetical protein